MNTFNIIAVVRLFNYERTKMINELFLTKTGTLYEFKNNTLMLISEIFGITGKELLQMYNENTNEYFSAKFGIIEIDEDSISDVLSKYHLYGKIV